MIQIRNLDHRRVARWQKHLWEPARCVVVEKRLDIDVLCDCVKVFGCEKNLGNRRGSQFKRKS